MATRGFGIEIQQDTALKPLDELLAKSAPVDGVLAQILALEAYDVTFKLHDHDSRDTQNPLSLVMMHPQEDNFRGSRLQNTIKAFRRHKVGSHYNMSLQNFLRLPRHISDYILEDCLEEARLQAKMAQDALNNIPKPDGPQK